MIQTNGLIIIVLLSMHFSVCKTECKADIQDDISHCYVEGATVDFTCVYGQKDNDMTKASVMITTFHDNRTVVLNKTILGTNTIKGNIKGITREQKGKVACYYNDEKCDCTRKGPLAEFIACSFTVYIEREPGDPVNFQCHIDQEDFHLKCSWKSESSPCWKLFYIREDGDTITCKTDDHCPGPGVAHTYQLLNRSCITDDPTMVTRNAVCPWEISTNFSDTVHFHITSDKFQKQISSVKTFEMNERRVKLSSPGNISIDNIGSTSLGLTWMSSCVHGFKVRCKIQVNMAENNVTKFVTSSLCSDTLTVGLEETLADLRPFTYYELCLSCSVDGGYIESDIAKVSTRTNASEPLTGPLLYNHLFQRYRCNSTKECLILYWKDQDLNINNGIITGYSVEVREEGTEAWSDSEGDSQSAVVELSDTSAEVMNVSVWSINEAGSSLNASQETIHYDKSIPPVSCVSSIHHPWNDPYSHTYKVSLKTSSTILGTLTTIRVMYYYCLGTIVSKGTVHCNRNLDWVEGNITGPMLIHVPYISQSSDDAFRDWYFGVGLIINGKSRGITWGTGNCDDVIFIEQNKTSDQDNIVYSVVGSIIAVIVVISLIVCVRKVRRYQQDKFKIHLPGIPLSTLTHTYTEVESGTVAPSYEGSQSVEMRFENGIFVNDRRNDVIPKYTPKEMIENGDCSALENRENINENHNRGERSSKHENQGEDTMLKTVLEDSKHHSDTMSHGDNYFQSETDSGMNFNELLSSSSTSRENELPVPEYVICEENDTDRHNCFQRQESSGFNSGGDELERRKAEEKTEGDTNILKETKVHGHTISEHSSCSERQSYDSDHVTNTKEVIDNAETNDETVVKEPYTLPISMNTDFGVDFTGYVSHCALNNRIVGEGAVDFSASTDEIMITENVLEADKSNQNSSSGSSDATNNTSLDSMDEYVRSTVQCLESESDEKNRNIDQDTEGEKERQERERSITAYQLNERFAS